MSLICFDLEGPLTPQDNAYELMKLFPRGDRIFEVISRYDDLLALEGRPDYEPGDTLALIAPFLAYHRVEEEQIAAMGRAARLMPGAAALISKLKSQGWHIFCITTSYEQYACAVTQRLSIPGENVACTAFPLTRIRQLLNPDVLALLNQAEGAIANLNPFVDDARIREQLDHLYRQKLPETLSGGIINQVRAVGGRHKVEALQNFSTKLGKPLSRWTVVGDSITDSEMLRSVNKAGGLAIAFNANEYALPYSTLSLASVTLYDLWVALEAWEKGGRRAVERQVREREKPGENSNRGHFHWLAEGKDITIPLEIHKRIRHLVREESAKLG